VEVPDKEIKELCGKPSAGENCQVSLCR